MEAPRSANGSPATPTMSANLTPEERFLAKFDRMLKHFTDSQKYKRCVMRSPIPYGRELADRVREEGIDLPKVKGGIAQLPQQQEISIVETYLENYVNVFKVTAKNPEKHKQHMKYFNDQVYRKYKNEFLRGPEDTEWLSEGSVSLQYAPESKNANNRKVSIKVSIIYRDAVESAKFKEEELNRKKADEEEWLKANELNYPEGTLLYLFRLCLECETVEEDRKILDKHTKTLEKELRIVQDTTPNSDNGALGQFISRMTRGRKDLPKIDVPEGSNALVDGIVGTINSNPQLENIIKGVLDGVDFSGKPESLFASLALNITDPKLVDRVQEAAKTFDPNTLPESLKKTIPMPAQPPMAMPPDPFAKAAAQGQPAQGQPAQGQQQPAPAQPPSNGVTPQNGVAK
jgi:hypothetical protein